MIDDLILDCGAEIIPGTTAKIYAVCGCDVDTYPELKTTTSVGDSITLDGNIILKTGKKWATIDLIESTGKITDKEVGEIGSQTIQSTFEFKISKTKAADEWVSKTRNGCVIYLVEDREGNIRVFGDPKSTARRTNAEGVNGPAQENAKDYSFTIMTTNGRVAPYYEGTIDLTA